MKRFLPIFLALSLSGCGTVLTQARVQKMTSQELYNRPWNSSTEQAIINNDIRLNEIIKRHPEWTKEDIKLLKDNRIWIGMNKDQFLTQYGYPDRINKSANIYGKSEQWIYGSFPDSDYYYFDNDVLTSWQR